MPSIQRVYGSNYHAGSHNKAKDRRGAHHFRTGKYKRQWQRTAANARRRLQKHLSVHPDDRSALMALKLRMTA